MDYIFLKITSTLNTIFLFIYTFFSMMCSGPHNQKPTIEKYESELIGKSFYNSKEMVYISNYSEKSCKEGLCPFKTNRSLRDFHNYCSGCLAPERLSSSLKMELAHVGTKFTVLSSFIVRSSKNSSKYLIVSDDLGRKSEIYEDFFIRMLVKGKYMNTKSISANAKEVIDSLRINKPIYSYHCKGKADFNNEFRSKMRDIKDVSKAYLMQKSAFPEIYLVPFIKDFNLEKEISIMESYFIIPDIKKIDPTELRKKDLGICVKAKYKSLNSYLLTSYYGRDWDLGWFSFSTKNNEAPNAKKFTGLDPENMSENEIYNYRRKDSNLLVEDFFQRDLVWSLNVNFQSEFNAILKNFIEESNELLERPNANAIKLGDFVKLNLRGLKNLKEKYKKQSAIVDLENLNRSIKVLNDLSSVRIEEFRSRIFHKRLQPIKKIMKTNKEREVNF